MKRGKIVTSVLLPLFMLMASPLCAVAQRPASSGIAISLWIMLLVCLFVFVIWISLYVVVAMMAKERNRNVALWVLVSIFSTPLLAIIILLCIGRAYNPYDEDLF